MHARALTPCHIHLLTRRGVKEDMPCLRLARTFAVDTDAAWLPYGALARDGTRDGTGGGLAGWGGVAGALHINSMSLLPHSLPADA